MKTAFITGATSGIGKATAERLAQRGYRLILTGRRQDRLQALQQQLQTLVPVHTCCFDVRDRKAVMQAVAALPADFTQVDVLVNNAGNAHGLASIQEGNIDDWDAMIDINVKGLLYVSKAVLPKLIAQGHGHIVNIGSIAGKEVYANGNVYCASKHAVDALSAAMRIDLNGTGIKVSEVNPGLVETEFSLVRFKGDEDRAKKVYDGLEPLKADDIADLIEFIVTRPAHVNIADVTIFPAAQASAAVVKRNS